MLREFRPSDAASLARVALAAFEQFKLDYTDWQAMAASLARMPELSRTGEIIVAEQEDRIVGGVAYVGVGRP
ncbi:MAG: hypothetical protein NW223_20450 [Hyphomicrobiaceae bacterium]|nr:hypothetical protein [Hyphomicrobiaceae bacterium]